MPETHKTFTQTEFMEMLELLNKQNRETMLEAVREMKKLPAHEQEALDKKLKREAELRRQRIAEAIADQRTKEQREFACEVHGHKKWNLGVPNPAHAISGQVNNDDCFRPTCLRCFKQFPKIRAIDKQIKEGAKLLDIKSLTSEMIYEWHFRTFPNCEDCKKGNCAKKMLRQLKTGMLDPLPKVLPDGKVVAEAVGQEVAIA